MWSNTVQVKGSWVIVARAVGAATLVAAVPLAAQPASLVYLLGKDTVAVEQYTRTGDRVVGEMVQRAGGAVTRLQYDLRTGADGRIASATFKRLRADGTPPPNTFTETRFRFTRDSVVREQVWPDSVQRVAFAAPNATISLPTYVWGPTELLAVARRAGRTGDSLAAVGLTGGVTHTGLQPAGRDTFRLQGGFYPMLLVYDASGRLQSVDGTHTTNKVIATRGKGGLNLAELARTMKPTGVLSARDVARASFGPGGIVLVDYSRPMVRERSVWGGTLIPFDSVWRAGANDATHLITTRTLTLGDMTLPPGMYTLWVQHTRTGTFLIVNRQTGQWGTQYDPKRDVGRVAMHLASTSAHVEEFTIAVRAQANRGALELSWGDTLATVPFVVSAQP
jgi:hypothetical protein